MKHTLITALFLIGSITASAAGDYNTDDCQSKYNRPIAVRTSTGTTTYLWPNTRTGWCKPSSIDAPFFSMFGPDSIGSVSREDSCGDGGKGEGSS